MLRDDAFMMPAAPAPLRRMSAYELATLDGVGDRGFEAARAEAWRAAGPGVTAAAYVAPFAIGDEVYFRVGEHEGAGKIAGIHGDEFVVETEPGVHARVASIYCAHRGRVKRGEEHRRAVRHALGTAKVAEVLPLHGGDAIVRVSYRLGMRPDESEVRALVAERFPHANVLDAQDHGTHLDVVVHHGPAQLCLQRSAEAILAIGRRVGALVVRERAVERRWDGGATSHFTVEAAGQPAFVNARGQLTAVLSEGAVPASGRIEALGDGRVQAFLHSAQGDVPIDLDADVSLEAKLPPVSQLSRRDFERMRVQHGGPSEADEETKKRREEEAAKRRRQQNQPRPDFEPHQLGAEHIGGPGAVVANARPSPTLLHYIIQRGGWIDDSPAFSYPIGGDAFREIPAGASSYLRVMHQGRPVTIAEAHGTSGWLIGDKGAYQYWADLMRQEKALDDQTAEERARERWGSSAHVRLAQRVVAALPMAPFDARTAAAPLTESLLHSRQQDPSAGNAIDRLVVEFLARSPEALDRIAPGAYGKALDGAVAYWEKMDPKKLRAVQQRFAPEQDPVDMRGAPSAWTRFTEGLSERKRLQREVETGAATSGPTSGAPARAKPDASDGPTQVSAPPTTADGDRTNVDRIPAGSIAPQSVHTLAAGTPVQGQNGKSTRLTAPTEVKVLKVDGAEVLVMAPGNKFLVVPSAAFARAASTAAAPASAAVRVSATARFRTAATWEATPDREGANKVPAKGDLKMRHEKYRRRGKRLAVDVLWEVGVAKSMTPAMLEQSVISYCKSLPANDVGMVGSVRVVAIDPGKGRATATFASSNQVQYPREEYT